MSEPARTIVERVQSRVAPAAVGVGGSPIVVGVSGGPDSICLLHSLVQSANGKVIACHVDHGLRDSSSEVKVVAELCRKLKVRLVKHRVDTHDLMRREGLSMEMAARELRYTALRQTAEEAQAVAIAVGHTCNDQAETILMHVLTGTGIAGLRGMHEMREGILRPLISIGRRETLAYCEELGLGYVLDPSNEDQTIRRNRLRHCLLPALTDTFPGASASLVRLGQLVERDVTYLEELSRAGLERVVASGLLDPALFLALPQSLQFHVLRLIRGESGLAVSAELLQREIEALRSGRKRTSSGPLSTDNKADLALEEPIPPDKALPLLVPGRTVVGGLTFDVSILAISAATGRRILLSRSREAYLDLSLLTGQAVIRSWQSGDRMRPLGLGGTRKLQDVFVDHKVPKALRSRVPIIEADSIAWLAGVGMSNDFRVTARTDRVVHVVVSRGTERSRPRDIR